MTSEAVENPTTPEEQIPSEAQVAIEKQMKDVEALVGEFRRLLVRFEDSLITAGVGERLQTLERWAESYRRGLKAAAKISECGPKWLQEANERLKLAADELSRMDAESPAPTPGDQATKTEDYLKATRRIDQLIPAMDQTLGTQTDTKPNTKEANHEPV